MKRVIVAPHADDEVMGCGGLLAKYPSECIVVVVAVPTPVRFAEFVMAQEVLGYDDTYLLGLPDSQVPSFMPQLVAALDEVLAEEKPDELYVPFPSLHQDHVATYEGGLRAARLSMTEGHWFPPSVLVYDVAAYDVNLYPSDLRWNVFESLTADQVEKKVAAIDCYESEKVNGVHPVNGVRTLAEATGHARKVEFAEQFALVREVR